jgi:hypothetical protein
VSDKIIFLGLLFVCEQEINKSKNITLRIRFITIRFPIVFFFNSKVVEKLISKNQIVEWAKLQLLEFIK